MALHLGDKDNQSDLFNKQMTDAEISVKMDAVGLTESSKKYVYQVISKTPSTTSSNLLGRALLWLGIPFRAAWRVFFPSAANLLDDRIAHLNKAFSDKTNPSKVKLALENERPINHDEMKEVMHSWLFSTFKDSIREVPLNRVYHLLNELADSDVSNATREAIKDELKTLSRDPKIKQQFPQLPLAISSFIDIFDQEHKIEESMMKPLSTDDYLEKLLIHPNVLKRSDVAAAVSKMPESALRQRVLKKMETVLSRGLQKAHEKENALLKNLPTMLQELSFDDLTQKYSSDVEKNYLTSRLKVVTKKIEESKAKLQGKEDFNFKILKFEKTHLENQIASMEAAQAALATIGTIPYKAPPSSQPPAIEHANKITAEEIERVRSMLSDRVTGSLNQLPNALNQLTSTTTHDQLAADLKKLSGEYEDLKTKNNQEFLTEVIPFTKKLQQLESLLLMHSPTSHDFLAHTNEQVAKFTQIKAHLDDLHTLSTPWKDLSEIKTNEQRKLERQEGLAKDVIRLSLEKNPDCQLVLRLAGMDARVYETPPSPNDHESTLDADLKKHALEFIDSIQAKNLESVKTKLFSLREYTTDIHEQHLYQELDPVRQKIDSGEINRFDVDQFARGLDLTEPLQKWQSNLQQVWADHIPREQEEEILAISDKGKRLQKMEACFSTWLWAKTHTKLMTQLSFEGIQIKDLSDLRKAQFKKIAPVVRKFRGEETILKTKGGLASQSVTKAVSDSLVEHAPTSFQIQSVNLNLTEYKEMNVGSIASSNPVKVLQESRRRIFGDPSQPVTLEKRGMWIRELTKNPLLHSLTDLRLTVISECKELAKAYTDAKLEVPKDLQEIFLNQYRDQKSLRSQQNSPLDFSKLNNLELRNFLDVFLLQTFAGNKNYSVTNQQRYYLVQFCSLSSLPDKQIEELLKNITVDNRNASTLPLSDLFTDVGTQLQASLIGLEGIEESALQKSVQKSNLPRTPETRQLLDSWRARAGSSLLSDLFRYSIDVHDKSHDQGREAIARAIYHAFEADPQKGIVYLKGLLNVSAVNADAFNPQTLAPPLRIFYLDCLLRLSLVDKSALKEVQEFNEGLIKSKNVNQMVMGFSREIDRLSNALVTGSISNEDFAKLLKYKLAYQKLKLEHYHNKVEISGFLKVATDAADVAMISSATDMQKKLAEPGYLKIIQPHLLMNVFNEERYADKLLKDVFRNQEDIALVSDPDVPGYLSLGERVQIDGVLGVLYINGSQKLALPANLQNHPDMRSLNIHTLPYIQDVPGGPFIYYTSVKGRQEAQITVTELAGQPIIHKKLPTHFGAAKQLKQLQFVPKETLALPYALEHRMGIKNFWIDESNTLYGFDDKGDLAIILNKKPNQQVNSPDQWIVKLKEGQEYSFLTLNQLSTYKEHPVLKRLLASFNPNEILVNWEKESFFVPALGLSFIKKQDKTDKEPVWKCECKGITGKVLDTESPATSYLSLMSEVNKSKIEKINKDLKLAKKNLENEKAPGLSRVNKQKIYKLEREITRLNHALDEADGRILLTALPQEAFEEPTAAINHITYELIPPELSDIQTELRALTSLNFEKIKYNFTVYPFVLNFLQTKLKEAYKVAQTDSREEVQDRYMNLQLAYRAVKEEGERICDHQAEKVIFQTSRDGTIASNDFSGALALILDSKKTPLELIRELAKYPLAQPLTDSQLALFNRVSKDVERRFQESKGDSRQEMSQLNAYLNLLSYQHLSFQVEELAHSTLSDKMDKVKGVEMAFAEKTVTCNTLLNDLASPSSEVVALWKKTPISPQRLASISAEGPKAVVVDRSGKAIVTQELEGLSQETLLERFFATAQVASTPKDAQLELSAQHKSLIKSFQQHSPDQVAGFYLEELGRFDMKGLNAEFRVNDQTGLGLYGMNKEHVERLFTFLKKENYISQKGADNYYSLTSPEYATTLFSKDQVRALMADLPLSEVEIQKITDRLQAYLFKAMQAGFKFSFKDKKVEAALMQKLEQEKETHLEKYLDAEAIIKAKTAPYGISLVEVKYAILSGDYRNITNKTGPDGKLISPDELPALRSALIRYLFHKTEVQHIENILKAPNLGERNKIELLQTKRNYSVDKLLQEGLTGKEREEQIIQRAFLVFEEDYGFRCNAMQIKMFRSLLLDSKDGEAIDAAQARMGFGKTALLPIMAIVRVAIERNLDVSERHMVKYVVPRAVIEDNTSTFNQRLSSITGGNVVKDRDFTRYQIDKKDPSRSFDLMITDLNKRLTFYKETRNQGNVLIQWPEIRGSMEAQDLDLGEMICQGGLSDELLGKCLECKRLLGEMRSISTYTIFDELDDTQDIKSREVNYTRGEKTLIPVTTIRPMEKLISFVGKQDDWKNTRAVAKKMLQEVAGIKESAITEDLITYVTDKNAVLNEKIHPFLSNSLKDFIQGKGVSKLHTEPDSALFLIRAILLDPNMLALAKNKQPNTHFGARFAERDGLRVYFNDPDSQSPLLIAVPYEGTNTPKGLSIFDNTEVAGITTLRYYLSKETLFSVSPHLDFLIKQVRKNTIPADLSLHYLQNMRNQEGQTPLDQLKEIAGMLDEAELKQAKDKFYNDFLRNPTEDFRKFFGMAVVATQIRSDAASAKSDRYEKASPDSVEKGCSGTVGGTSSYFDKQETDPAADGKLSLEIMGRANNAPVSELSAPRDNQDYLEEILTTLLSSCNENTRAIIDTAGICKSKDGTPETVVAKLFEHLQKNKKMTGIEGIVYYGKDNIKRLYRGPNLPAIPCTTAMELAALDGKKYFSFYGQKNTRGSDIKQANDVHALVTIDENVSNSDAKQAILRFRNLVNRDSGQTFSFAFMPGFTKILKDKLKVDASSHLDAALQEQANYNSQLSILRQSLSGGSLSKEHAVKVKGEIKTLEDALTAINVQVATLNTRITHIDQIKIEAKEIANYLRLQEKELEEKAALAIFRKEMSAHIKQAAAHLEQNILKQLPAKLTDEQKLAYVEFLKARNAISGFVEHSIDTLYYKYGTATTDQNRNAFIEAQQIVVAKKLQELFQVAQVFSQKVNSPITIKKSIYTEQIDRSVKFFQKRFEETTPVQVTNVDAGAMAIAQALAEAFAQAEAEGLAEKLSENVVEVLDRHTPLVLETTTEAHPEVSLDFLRNDQLRHPAEKVATLHKLIKSSLRDKFQVSDFVFKQNIVAHFVLVKDGAPTIFIAQEEADLFKSQLGSNQDMNGYALYDARTLHNIPDDSQLLDRNKAEVKQLMCAIIGDNGVPEAPVPSTDKLRATSLTNVDTEQLLPHLEVHTGNRTQLQAYVNLTQFGVTGNTSVDLNVTPVSATQKIEISVKCGPNKNAITIPQNNKYLNKHVIAVYSEEGRQGKMLEVQSRVKAEYGALAEQLEALGAQKKALATKNAELNRMLNDPTIGNFVVTAEMKAGLDERDSEFASKGDYIQSQYGVLFKAGLEKINRARENQRLHPSRANLTQLKDAFNAFIDPTILANINSSNYSSTPLFSYVYWESNKSSGNLSPLELVYGRILYSVHGGGIEGAKSCTRQDCNCMFGQTLPALLDSVKQLTSTISEIEKIDQQAKIIEAQIAEINKRIPQDLVEADETITRIIEEQTKIEKSLTDKGIRFSEKNQFFDRFQLKDFQSWKEPASATVQSFLPDYKDVVKGGMEQGYLETIRAPTSEEEGIIKQNNVFLSNVLRLSSQVETRTNELQYV